MSSEDKLISDKRFWPTFWTQFCGAFNDNVFKDSMVLLITFKSLTLSGLGVQEMVALSGGTFILPFFLFSSLAGQVCDKYPKNKVMVWVKKIEILIMVVGAYGFLTDNILVLMSTLFFMGVQSTFFGPVKYSILPELLTDDELVEGNALIEIGTFLSILIGTILGGLAIGSEQWGGEAVSAIVIAIAVIGCYFSYKVSDLEPIDKELKIDLNLFRSNVDIINSALEVKSVWLSILANSWFWFLGAGLLAIFPVYAKVTLGCDGEVVTLFLALFSVGVAVGSFICEKLSKKRLELGLVPFGSIGITIFLFDLFLVGSPGYPITSDHFYSVKEFISFGISYRIMIDLFGLSLFSGFFIVPLYTFMQQRSRKEIRSRVIAANNIINALFMVLSSIMLVFLFKEKVTIPFIYLVFCGLNLLVACYVYFVMPEFLLRFFAMIITRLMYRAKVTGHEQIPAEGPAVLVCNHVSFVDWLVIAALVKRPIRLVMHHSFYKIPIIRFLFSGARVIPIAGAKENKETLLKAFDIIEKELLDGEIVCIFPEGEITHDKELNIFRPGIERIIERTPVPVIPMVLKGLWGSFFSRKYGRALSRPTLIVKRFYSKIELNISTPIAADKVKADELREIAQAQLDS